MTRLTKGYSLIEIMLAITILAIAIPAVGYVFSLAFREESDTSLESQAVFLANSLLNEISERRFKESAASPGNGPDNGEISGVDRRNFDDIDDYAAFQKDSIYQTAWGRLSPPLDESGTAMNSFSKFSQYAEVINVAPPTSGPTARNNFDAKNEGSTDFKLVTVEISWDPTIKIGIAWDWSSARRKVTLYKIFARH